jgi:hypothetical protein
MKECSASPEREEVTAEHFYIALPAQKIHHTFINQFPCRTFIGRGGHLQKHFNHETIISLTAGASFEPAVIRTDPAGQYRLPGHSGLCDQSDPGRGHLAGLSPAAGALFGKDKEEAEADSETK